MPDILAKECLTCPAGSYCVGDHITLRDCPPGFYCPIGTGYDWKPCPSGTFSNNYGLYNVSCKYKVAVLYVVTKSSNMDIISNEVA